MASDVPHAVCRSSNISLSRGISEKGHAACFPAGYSHILFAVWDSTCFRQPYLRAEDEALEGTSLLFSSGDGHCAPAMRGVALPGVLATAAAGCVSDCESFLCADVVVLYGAPFH